LLSVAPFINTIKECVIEKIIFTLLDSLKSKLNV